MKKGAKIVLITSLVITIPVMGKRRKLFFKDIAWCGTRGKVIINSNFESSTT